MKQRASMGVRVPAVGLSNADKAPQFDIAWHRPHLCSLFMMQPSILLATDMARWLHWIPRPMTRRRSAISPACCFHWLFPNGHRCGR